MSRGSTLATLRGLLKAEIRDSSETNTAADAEFNLLLSSKQRDLANQHDWPFLEHVWDLSFAAGDRWKTIPTVDIRGITCDINFERPVRVDRYFSTYYEPIDYGIGSEEYNSYDSDLNERSDPILKWRLSTNPNEASNPNQVEIWPIPQTATKIRFFGQRNVQTLASDSDKADLDDRLIVYFVAADYLAHREMANATLMLQKAQQILVRLRAGYPQSETVIKLGLSSSYEDRKIRRVPVAIAP